MPVEFQDFSMQVKNTLDNMAAAWLHTWSNEIASQAARNCQMTEDDHGQLKGSYESRVNNAAKEAVVGTPLESGYWEEWGTGEYAAHGDGRKGWWIYIEGEESQGGGQAYKTREEAEQMAAYIRARYGKNAVATNGRRANYTLERAFTAVKPKAERDLERRTKEGLGK